MPSAMLNPRDRAPKLPLPDWLLDVMDQMSLNPVSSIGVAAGAMAKAGAKAAPQIAKAITGAAAKRGASVASKAAPKAVAPVVQPAAQAATKAPNSILAALARNKIKTGLGIGGAGLVGSSMAGLDPLGSIFGGGGTEEVPQAAPKMGTGMPRMGTPPIQAPSQGPDFAALDQMINQLNGPKAQPTQQQQSQPMPMPNPMQSAIMPQQEKGFDWMKMLQVVGPLLAAVIASRAGR